MRSRWRWIVLLGVMGWSLTGYAAPGLIPLPNHMEPREGRFLVNRTTEIYAPQDSALGRWLNDRIEQVCGYRLPMATHRRPLQQIVLLREASLPEEGYTLEIVSGHVRLCGRDRAGLFYGLQTLLQWMPASVYRTEKGGVQAVIDLEGVRIEDAPRFPYRGVMLDVSRNFFDAATVKQYIDWMAVHKLNRLHWHLTDDNGWRIEILSHPELTTKGAWRGPGEVLPPSYGSGRQRYGGYYTQAEIRDIVRYAEARNVTIIPEIDLPGHSQTLTAVYPACRCTPRSGVKYEAEESHNVLCVAREENYALLEDILREVASLFPSRYLHIGCDEVSSKYWQQCTRCQALRTRLKLKKTEQLQDYFVQRMERILHGLGKRCAAWNEAASNEHLHESALFYGWLNVEACRKVADAERPLVMMPASYCYIDMKQSATDRGHSWAGRVDLRRVYSFEPEAYLTAEQMRWVRGVEAAQWSELLDRPAGFLAYQGYPRLCALAEVGWTLPSRRNWEEFYRRLTQAHLPRLEELGVGYRVDAPQMIYHAGTIGVASAPEGCDIRYTTDLSEPSRASLRYQGSIATKHPEHYRFRAFLGTGQSAPVGATVPLEPVALSPGESRTVRIPLSERIDQCGIWMFSVDQLGDDATLTQLEVKGVDTTLCIVRNGERVNPLAALRIYVDSTALTAELCFTLRNNAAVGDTLYPALQRSPYIEPEVKVSSSIPTQRRFPIDRSVSYRFADYVRSDRACRPGDSIVWRFATPVACRMVDVRTGLPDVTRYIVTDGVVELSYDGVAFEPMAELDANGDAVVYPTQAVRAVRIMLRDGNGEPTLAWQNLRIVPSL